MQTFPIDSFLEIFDELYTGKAEGKNYTWVIDREPGLGFTNFIAGISAEQASTALFDGGSTLAAHTEHLRWSLNFALSFFEGKQPEGKWPDSWRIKEVNENEWKNLQAELKQAYLNVRKAAQQTTDWSDPLFVNGVLALLPHVAYHLGSIKQMALVLKAK